VNYVLVTGDNEIIAATDKHIEFFAPKSAANSALRSPSGALSLSAFDIDWVQTRPAIALDMCTALALVDPTRNRLLISAQANGLIRLIDLTANSEVWRLDSRLGRVHSISNSSDGKYIATVHWRQTVVWDLQNRNRRYSLPTTPYRTNGVSFSPDGSTIATSDSDGLVRLWNAETGSESSALHCPFSIVNDLAFSPDGQLLAAVSSRAKTQVLPHALRPSGRITIWDVRRRTIVAEYRGHAGGSACLAFSPNGRILATGGVDGSINLWNVPSEK
jgi:WD40 repeat protein